jgi:hypothetical protein
MYFLADMIYYSLKMSFSLKVVCSVSKTFSPECQGHSTLSPQCAAAVFSTVWSVSLTTASRPFLVHKGQVNPNRGWAPPPIC